MPIGDDFSVTRSTRAIRVTGGVDNYTVLELHRWLMDLADDASSVGDDEKDITDPPGSDKSFDTIITLINGYNIDQAVAERLYAGSITQGSGGTLERWSGVQIVGSFPAGSSPQLIQNNVKLTNFWGNEFNPDPARGISHRILIKTTNAGAEIDGGRIRGQYRGYGNQYVEAATVLGVGNETLALGNISADQFNGIDIGTIVGAPYTSVANDNEGYNLIDLNNGNGPQPYYSLWNPNATDLSGLYNRVKYLTRDGSGDTLYGLNGELYRGVTHEIDIDTPTGSFEAVEPVSWTGGTGQMLAIDSLTAGTKMWIQLLTGTPPVDNDVITGASSTATAQVNVAVIERPVSQNSVIGSFFGSILGGFGVGVVDSFLSASDQLIDLFNVTQTPPNNVSISVFGLEGGVSDQDYILLGRDNGSGDLETDRYSANGAQLAASTTFTVNEIIDSDNPASGTVRIFNAVTNSFNKVAYTSYAGSVFTLATTIGFDVADTAEAFVPFLDDLASGGTLGQEDGSITSAVIYSSDITVNGTVRNGNTSVAAPIKPFPLSGAITSSGFSVTAVRTLD